MITLYAPHFFDIRLDTRALEDKGSSINDVTQLGTFFDPPSPIIILFITEALALLSQNP